MKTRFVLLQIGGRQTEKLFNRLKKKDFLWWWWPKDFTFLPANIWCCNVWYSQLLFDNGLLMVWIFMVAVPGKWIGSNWCSPFLVYGDFWWILGLENFIRFSKFSQNFPLFKAIFWKSINFSLTFQDSAVESPMENFSKLENFLFNDTLETCFNWIDEKIEPSKIKLILYCEKFLMENFNDKFAIEYIRKKLKKWKTEKKKNKKR